MIGLELAPLIIKALGVLGVVAGVLFGWRQIKRSGVDQERARAAAAAEAQRKDADHARAEISTAGPAAVRGELRRYQRD